jgi:hypothetical protein
MEFPDGYENEVDSGKGLSMCDLNDLGSPWRSAQSPPGKQLEMLMQPSGIRFE